MPPHNIIQQHDYVGWGQESIYHVKMQELYLRDAFQK